MKTNGLVSERSHTFDCEYPPIDMRCPVTPTDDVCDFIRKLVN